MAAEQQRDGSSDGGSSLYRSVDESVGSVGGSFGGSCSSIGSLHALRNPAPAAPYAHIGDAQMQALEQLAVFF